MRIPFFIVNISLDFSSNLTLIHYFQLRVETHRGQVFFVSQISQVVVLIFWHAPDLVVLVAATAVLQTRHVILGGHGGGQGRQIVTETTKERRI